MKEKSKIQILRFDGNNVFMEVLNSAFEIDKVFIRFAEYDKTKETGSKFTKEVTLYLDMDKAQVLCHDILSGRMTALANAERNNKAKRVEEAKKANKETKYIYCKEIYTDLGGISAENVKKRLEKDKDSFRFEIPEGKALSRQLKITPGDKIPWIFSGEHGLGEENETGLIVPQGKPVEIIRVPLTDEDFKRFAVVIQSHIAGFITSQYMKATKENK